MKKLEITWKEGFGGVMKATLQSARHNLITVLHCDDDTYTVIEEHEGATDDLDIDGAEKLLFEIAHPNEFTGTDEGYYMTWRECYDEQCGWFTESDLKIELKRLAEIESGDGEFYFDEIKVIRGEQLDFSDIQLMLLEKTNG